MDLLAAISNALNSATKPAETGRPDFMVKGDIEAARRDLATTPRPGALRKTDRRIDELTRQLAEAAEQREQLLALGRKYRQQLAGVEALKVRLAEGAGTIATLEGAATESWAHAQTYFGNHFYRDVSTNHATQALSSEAAARAMRERFLPALQAELETAQAEVIAFSKKHDIAEIEAAETASE